MIRVAPAVAMMAFLLAPVPPDEARAQTVAVIGGRVATGDGSVPADGATVVFRDGRILSVGHGRVPVGARVIDATGKWVTPGIFGGFTRLGLVEVDGVSETNDTRAANSPFGAAISVAPAINPRATAIQVNRAGGVTRAIVAPEVGRDLFAGQGAVIDLGADMDAVTRPDAFQFAEFGEAGASAAGGSRAAAHVQLRNALYEAQDYARNPGGYQGGRDRDALLMRLDAKALVPVVEGRQPLLIHAERAADILQALSLKREFARLKLVLVGVSEGWMVADRLAAARVPVIASALNDLPARFEMLAATQSNIGRMTAAGVEVAIGMIDDNDARQTRLQTQYAGNLVALKKVPGASGLDWGQALRAITLAPARIIGVGGELGSLEAGKRADVVIWDGDPLELSSVPIAVFIDGVEQPLATRQTRLRERYAPTDVQPRPRVYRR